MLPTYSEDLYSDEGIRNANAHFRKIRDLGPLVELTATNVLAAGRYDDVRRLLLDHTKLISSKGVALNEATNRAAAGIPLTLDPPEHTRLRKILDRPLTRPAVETLRAQIEQEADNLVRGLVARGEFDGIKDLARILPMSIISTLVGLPEEGRESMIAWAAASHDVNGPVNERTLRGADTFYGMIEFATLKVNRDNVRAGSWAARIYEAADEGLISAEEVVRLIISYVVPSLETTISAIGHMLDLFGQNPDQRRLLKKRPTLIPNAVEEVLRLRTPVRSLARHSTTAASVGEIAVPEGRFVVMLYASANRDERKWINPDVFDITRADARDHLAFGMGIHRCSGQHLAKLEITSILNAITRHVDDYEVGPSVPGVNNILSSLRELPVHIRA